MPRAWLKLLLGSLVSAHFVASAMEIFTSDANDFGYIMADGVLDEQDINGIGNLMENFSKRGKPSVILLTSPGGVLEFTPDIAERIVEEANEFYMSHHRPALLVINSECSSACTVMMANITKHRNPSALEIWVTPGATFGFHSPVNKPKGGRTSAIADLAEREFRSKKQLNYLTEAGVNPAWLSANLKMFYNAKMTDLTGRQLCEEKAMVIPPDSCLPNDNDVIPLIEAKYFRPKHLIPNPYAKSRKKKP